MLPVCASDASTTVGFDLLGGLKDVQLILDASTEAGVPLPFANVLRDKALTA